MSTDEAVRAFYKDRLSNDAEQFRDWFTDCAHISMNGSGVATGQIQRQRHANDDPKALTNVCNAITNQWHWHSAKVLESVAQGDKASTRVLVDLTYRPTGKRTHMEFAEFIHFNGERITEMIAFVDTLAAEALQQPG